MSTFAQALGGDVGASAEVAGGAADQHAEHEGDGHADQPDGQRNAPAVQQPRQHVAPEVVSAEQEEHGPVRVVRVDGFQAAQAEQVHAGLEQPQQAVGIAFDEQADRVGVAGNRAVHLSLVRVEFIGAVGEVRPAQAVGVGDAHPGDHRRVIRLLAGAAGVVIRRQEVGEQGAAIEQHQGPEAEHRQAVAAQPEQGAAQRRARHRGAAGVRIRRFLCGVGLAVQFDLLHGVQL